MISLKTKDKKRFWAKVNKTNNCWLWKSTSKKRYGEFKLNYKMEKAHRVSWAIKYKNIPNNLFVLHKCDIPKCVNPSHLFLGTQQDNIKDMIKKGRQPSFYNRNKYCSKGHEITDVKRSSGNIIRRCLVCDKIRNDSYREINKEKRSLWHKEYYKKNRLIILARQKKYKLLNKEQS